MDRYFAIIFIIGLMAVWKLHVPLVGILLVLLIMGYAVYNKKVENRYAKQTSPPDITDQRFRNLYFSIMEYKTLSPDNFNKSVDNTREMLQVFKDISEGSKFCKDNYDILEEKARNAENYLHSIVYSLDNAVLNEKLMVAINKLRDLNCEYLTQAKQMCQSSINKNGYNIDTRLTSGKVKGYNYYMNDENEIFNYY